MYDLSAYGSLRDLQFSFQYENYIQMMNGFLLWMKLFKYMTFSHRVRFLFTMLQRSSKDLFIFSIVLCVFYCSFGIMAFLLFSSDVSDFRSFPMSFFNLIRFTVTEMDYDALTNSNRMLGNMFYVVWSILMIMILANVFIAILSEAYASISDDEDDGQPILRRLTSSINSRIHHLKHSIAAPFGWNSKSTLSVFNQTDSNRDGRLDTNEIADALNLDDRGAEDIIDRFDEDGDHQLNQQELHRLKQEITANKEEVRSEVDVAKKDKKGRKRSVDEMHRKLDRLEAVLAKLAAAQSIIGQKTDK